MSKRPRIPGYDLARFLAVLGFVIVDFVGFVVWGDNGAGFGERPAGPTSLYWLWMAWWGRASAMLAVLAGTGLALFFREGDPDDVRASKRRVILRRCVFLFVAGHLWNSSTLWSWSILHYYTFFLAIGLLFVRCRPRTLAIAALAFLAVGNLDTAAFKEAPDWMSGDGAALELAADGGTELEEGAELEAQDAPEAAPGEAPGKGSAEVPGEALTGADAATGKGDLGKGEWDDKDWEGDFGDPKIWEAEFFSIRHHLVMTLFDGMYPVFPWMAFLLLGMAVVRIGLDDAPSRRKVLLVTTLVTGLAYAAWWAARHFGWGETAELWTNLDRMACMPGYVITAGGQAVILICLALEIAERWPRAPWLPALVATGQMTFSVYIFRIFIGGGDRDGLYDLLGFADGSSRSVLTDGWIRVAIFMPLAILACHLWVKRFGRGPLEAAMRKYSDR